MALRIIKENISTKLFENWPTSRLLDYSKMNKEAIAFVPASASGPASALVLYK